MAPRILFRRLQDLSPVVNELFARACFGHVRFLHHHRERQQFFTRNGPVGHPLSALKNRYEREACGSRTLYVSYTLKGDRHLYAYVFVNDIDIDSSTGPLFFLIIFFSYLLYLIRVVAKFRITVFIYDYDTTMVLYCLIYLDIWIVG